MATLSELKAVAAKSKPTLSQLKEIAARSQQPQVDVSGQTLQVGPFDTGVELPESLTAGLIAAGRGMTTVGRGLGLAEREDPATTRAFEQLGEQFPISTTTGEILGEASPFLIPGAGISAIGTQAGRIGAAAALGATEGAILSSGRGQSLPEAVKSAGIGGLVAGGLEAISPVLGRLGAAAVSRVTGKPPVGELLDRSGRPTEELQKALADSGQTFEDLTQESVEIFQAVPRAIPEQAVRAARFQELDIPSTAGDISQSFQQQVSEARLLESPDPVAQPMRDIRLSQSRAFRENLENMVARTGIPQESGDSVIAALEGQKDLLRTEKNKLYREFAETSPEIREVPIITDSISGSLPDARTLRRIGRLAPSQSGAVDDLLIEFGLDRDPAKIQSFVEAGGEIEQLNIGNFDDFRQAVNLIESTDQTNAIKVITGPIKRQLDEEAEILEGSLKKGGVTDEGVLAPLEEARSTVTELKTEFDPNRLAGQFTNTKARSRERKVQSSQVKNRIIAKSTPIEQVNSLMTTLDKSPDGKKARADLQADVIADLLDSSFSTASRKIGGELVFNPGAFNRRIDQLGTEKVESIFGNNPKSLDQLKKLSETAADIQPTAAATPKGSASVILDLVNKAGLGAVANSPTLLGIKELARIVKEKGSNTLEIQKALDAKPELRETASFIQDELPGLAAPLGIATISIFEDKE